MIHGSPPFNGISGGPLAKMNVIADARHHIDYPEVAITRGVGVGQNQHVTVPPEATDSIKRCLMYRKEQRLTIPELLQHEFLRPRQKGMSRFSTELKSSLLP